MSDNSPDINDSGLTWTAPAQWFTLQLPYGLVVNESESALLEASPPGERPDWSLTLYSAWIDESSAALQPASFEPEILFPDLIHSTDGPEVLAPGLTRSWRGSSRMPATSWWQHLFPIRRRWNWCLWVIEYENILVVVSVQTRAGLPMTQQILDQCISMLNSLKFADQLALPPDLFRQEVLNVARNQFPLLRIEESGNFGLRLNDSEIHLANFYRSYISNPSHLRQIVLPGLTTVVRLQEWGPDQLMPPLHEVRDRIMPMLYPQAEARDSLAEFVQFPWVGGLQILFVLDEDESYRFVHEELLDAWQISGDGLYEIAMENLRLYVTEHPLEVSVVESDEQTSMLVPVNPSAWNSARLLEGQLHRRLREMLGAELVVGLPNRDFFVAVSFSFPELIGEVRQQVARDFRTMHHPLTERLLVISADGVSEFCE